jgi:hypothetical protein
MGRAINYHTHPLLREAKIMATRKKAKSARRAPPTSRRESEVVIGAAEQLLANGKTEEAIFTLLVGILRELGALR